MEGKILISADTLLSQITPCVKLATGKHSIEILKYLKVEATPKNDMEYWLKVTGSNNESCLTIVADMLECVGEFSFCVMATDLVKVLSGLKGKTITIIAKDDKLTIKHAKGRMTLPCIDATPYIDAPEVKKENHLTASTNAILNALYHVEGFTANNELRPVMNGVKFDFTQSGMVAVGSNGYALAKYSDASVVADNEFGVIFPKRASDTLCSALKIADSENISLSCDGGSMSIVSSKFKLVTRLIEGRYPNYNSVIPTDNHLFAKVNKHEFVDSLKRAILMANTTSGLISLGFENDNCKVCGEDIDYNTTAEENVPCTYADEPLNIGFKGGYLLDVVNTIDSENIFISLKSADRAGIISPCVEDGSDKGTEVLYLLMPMVLNN